MPKTKFDKPRFPPINDLRAAILERKFVGRLTWEEIGAAANVSGEVMRKYEVPVDLHYEVTETIHTGERVTAKVHIKKIIFSGQYESFYALFELDYSNRDYIYTDELGYLGEYNASDYRLKIYQCGFLLGTIDLTDVVNRIKRGNAGGSKGPSYCKKTGFKPLVNLRRR